MFRKEVLKIRSGYQKGRNYLQVCQLVSPSVALLAKLVEPNIDPNIECNIETQYWAQY